jgi:lysophospholipase L1-like esterase
MSRAILLASLALVVSACTTFAPPIEAGARYVAMGSSYAAGPGIPSYYEDPPTPCARSTGNYAHLLAARKGLALTDASCSGATTAHLLGPRGAIPPQLDALTPDTRLITVTIGGNDLGYMTQLFAASCFAIAAETKASAEDCAVQPPLPSEADYAGLAQRMDQLARDVRQRAPLARLIFVDYLTVLPSQGECAAAPLSAANAAAIRELARRLAAITAKAATDNGADILKASDLSAAHNACATDAWTNGYPRPNAPVAGTGYHPNAKGMIAIADALETLLR